MNKIEALKTTIEKLESGEYKYNWASLNNCNCGLVAKTLLNGENPTANGLFKYVDTAGQSCPSGFWGCYENTLQTCNTSGLPIPVVFDVLYKVGFTVDELRSLERGAYDKNTVVAYLRKWVNMLETYQLEAIGPPVKVITKYVSVPESITEQTTKLILS